MTHTPIDTPTAPSADTADEAPPPPTIDPAVLAAWLGRDLRNPRTVLTRRQLDVIALLGRGRSNEDIAAALGLSVRTVDRHLVDAYQRLNAGRTEAALLAFVYGIEGRAAG